MYRLTIIHLITHRALGDGRRVSNRMKKEKKILISGVKPTGKSHIGNYLGAMSQFLSFQDEYESYIFIPDYHALTTVQNSSEMRRLIEDIAIDYLAIGLDPKKVIFFKQSDVVQHMELAWIFNCITTMPYLMRAHAFKDAQAKSKEINVGVFDYPMLMAADILMYDPDIVPVGQDQKQHVEFTRDTAEKFNNIFGETFKIPKEYINPETAVIVGTDGRKMSKSYNNIISLFASNDVIKKEVMSIVTDSKSEHEPKDPITCNIFALHKFFSKEDLPEIRKRYLEGKIGYKESKEILVENLQAFIAPLRKKREDIEKDKDSVVKILKKGGEIAREIAEKKMKDVRKRIGVSLS